MAKIGIACGGTGGHLYPGLAVAEVLTGMGHQVKLYISTKEVDRVVLQSYPQYESMALPVTGWPGIGFKAPAFLKNFIQAYKISVAELRREELAAVLGMGGFTCAPLLLAAARQKVPCLLHESNSIPGKATRWLSGKMDRVLLGFEQCAKYLPRAQVRVTGTPVRHSLKRVPRETTAAWWGLQENRFTVAVMGGSQGAQGLNRLLIRAMPYWEDLQDHIQFIHLSGPMDGELVKDNYQRYKIPAVVRSFCDRMEYVYSMADLVVSRSGAASLTEIGSYGLPSILVPYPHAAEDHQTQNALIFVQARAAIMIPEKAGAAELLAAEVRRIGATADGLSGMAASARTMSMGMAARQVAQEVVNVL